MKIELISQEEYQTLLDIQKNFSVFTFQNVGYEGIDRSKFTEKEKQKEEEINAILKKSILGFVKFQNFKTNNPREELRLRFQYNWDADKAPNERATNFVGVGYISIEELLNGFKTEKE